MLKKLILLLLAIALLALRPAPQPATLALMGDVMLGRGVAQAHAARDWERAFSAIAPHVQRADLALANLESPLTTANTPALTRTARNYNLCAAAQSVQALHSAGIDILALANNHASDCSPHGADETRTILESNGMRAITADTPVYHSVGGVHLAFYAFDDVAAPLDIASTAQRIAQSRRQGRLPVISIHWGTEYHPAPDSRQRQMAQAFADSGAVLVWGHHPHVLQPIAWLQGAGQARPTLIAYSLGNALFDQPSPPDVRRSVLLLVTINAQGVQSFEILPLEIDFPACVVRPAVEGSAAAVQHRLGVQSSQAQ
ncbi:MAG: CapA family protein [Anaerolineae bacterium]|nr:CapA family protein [Anaerolineae bacterium]